MSQIIDEAKKIVEASRKELEKVRYMDRVFGKSRYGPCCQRCGGRGSVCPKKQGEWIICPTCHGTGRPY